MSQPIILSGVQATGKLHVGNYLGALKQFVDLQNSGDYHCFFFIADLHALTVPRDPAQLRQDTLEAVTDYLAAGIDPNKSTIFLQNHVPEHSELAWLFNCITPLGELERMTQFKDKSAERGENHNAGLLTYPVLMAADILLYKPVAVPVGEDQLQHLELARIIARKFNNRFGDTFPEPKAHMQKPLRVMSLTHPTKKMSKTGGEGILLDDSPEEIERKVKKAVTATEADQTSPGVENLLFLLRHFGDVTTVAQFEDALRDGTIKYSELKPAVSDAIGNYFADFRIKKAELLARPDTLAQILGDGAHKAASIARETLTDVKQKMGLL
jgi:tryptophanyl-tRNA synthetase